MMAEAITDISASITEGGIVPQFEDQDLSDAATVLDENKHFAEAAVMRWALAEISALRAAQVGVNVGVAEAVSAFVAADDAKLAACMAYNDAYDTQKRLGVFPMRLDTEYCASSEAQKMWWAACKAVIAAARSSGVGVNVGVSASTEMAVADTSRA
jgi:hypothetical protein